MPITFKHIGNVGEDGYGGGGGVGGYHSPFEQAYLNLAQRKEAHEEDITNRKLQLEEERSSRLEKSQMAKDEIGRMADVLKLKSMQRSDEAEARKMLKFDQDQSLADQADKLSLDVSKVDPLHRDANKFIDNIKNTEAYHRLMASKVSRDVLNEAFKSKQDEINNFWSSIDKEASDKYGLKAVDRSKVPYKSNGVVDIEKLYKQHLPNLSEQETQRAEARIGEMETPEGYEPDIRKDVYGRPELKGYKPQRAKAKDLEADFTKKTKLSSGILDLEPGQTTQTLEVQVGDYDERGRFVKNSKGEGDRVMLVDKTNKKKPVMYPMSIDEFTQIKEKRKSATPKTQESAIAAKELGINPAVMSGAFVPSTTPQSSSQFSSESDTTGTEPSWKSLF